MADASGPSGGGYDYVQDSDNPPQNPKLGQEWYQPDTDDAKTYDGGVWVDVKISDHDQLSGVSAGDHFSPGAGLTFNAGTLALLLSGYLEIDGNGDLAIAAGSIEEDRLAFSTATQSELDTHEGRTDNPHNVDDSQTGAAAALSDHASRTDNPHGVTDEQTGAAAALSDHASRSDNPHNVDDSQTGAAAALSSHEGDTDAHHSPPEMVDSGFLSANVPRGAPYGLATYGGEYQVTVSNSNGFKAAQNLSVSPSTSHMVTGYIEPGNGLHYEVWEF